MSSTSTGKPVRATRAAALSSGSSGISTPSKIRRPPAPRTHSVTAEHPALTVHEEQVGGLVAHALHEPIERLVVDLLGIERRVDRGAQLDQQGQLLDPGLELAELLLQLVVGVEDLLRLQVHEPLGVVPARPLPERHPDVDALDGRQRADRRRPPRAEAGDGHEQHGQADAGGQPAHGRQPEARAEREVLPVHFEETGIGAGAGALVLDHTSARETPVGGISRQHGPDPPTHPERHPGSRTGSEPKPRATSSHFLEPGNGTSHHLAVDQLELPVDASRGADPQGIGPEVGALLARLPVRRKLAQRKRPPLLIGVAGQLATEAHEVVGDLERNPVVVGHEVVTRAAGGAAHGLDRVRSHPTLDERDEGLGEDAVHLAGTIPPVHHAVTRLA